MRPVVFAATAASSLSMRPLSAMISLGAAGVRRKNHQAAVPASNINVVMARNFKRFFAGFIYCLILS
jgi:hypothetical protein